MKRRDKSMPISGLLASIQAAALAALILLTSGCSRPGGISDEYGTLSTGESRFSINGTSVLADAIRRRGNKVVIARKITPRIERFGAIVWFAAKNTGCPEPEVCDRINQWLDNDPNRKLIYVGWDADTAVRFWSDAAENSSGESAQAMFRSRAIAMAERDSGAYPSGMTPASCDWFQILHGQRLNLDRLVGENGAKIDTTAGSVELGAVRLMPAVQSGVGTILRTENGVPFVFSTASSPSAPSDNVLVVSNSSFLLNYSLLNATNRMLASIILDQAGPIPGPVMFLHSGQVDYSDATYEKQTAWSWINQPPVRYIVPHILVTGLVFIFMVFPVLGRPKSIDEELQPGLGRHVDAVGQLIVRSGKKAETELWLKSKMSADSESQSPGRVSRTNR